MDNSAVVKVLTTLLPLFVFCFITALIARKVYVKIRSNFNAAVNCWFCNSNTRVPYLETNSWTCRNCEQYNGFTKDGDYNRDMIQQRIETPTTMPSVLKTYPSISQNGFCDECNEAQRLKVEKLAQFKPKHERNYDREILLYKAKLEEQHRICLTCENHLKSVLRAKKKMVLGSKIISFVIKGAQLLGESPYRHFRKVQKRNSMRFLARITALFTVINIWCLLFNQRTWTNADFNGIFGHIMGGVLYEIYSRILAFLQSLGIYIAPVGDLLHFSKIQIFCRTIIYMLAYVMGLTLSDMNSLSLTALYSSLYPIFILLLTLAYCAYDNFSFSKYMCLPVLWSILSSGILSDITKTLMLPASLVTLWISFKCCRKPSANDCSNDSITKFQKLYSDGFLKDDETMTMLNEQLSSSSNSTYSNSAPSPATLLPVFNDLSINGKRSYSSVARNAKSMISSLADHSTMAAKAPLLHNYHASSNDTICSFQRSTFASNRILSNLNLYNDNISPLNIDTRLLSPLSHAQETIVSPDSKLVNNICDSFRSSTNLLLPSRFVAAKNSHINNWLDCLPTNRSQTSSTPSSGFESMRSNANYASPLTRNANLKPNSCPSVCKKRSMTATPMECETDLFQ